MTNIRGAIHNYDYEDDQSEHYKVRLTESVAAAGGFGAPLGADSTLPVWEGRSSQLRHVYIKAPDGIHHDRIPCATLTILIYKNGGSLNDIAGRDGWTVTGHKGESKTFT